MRALTLTQPWATLIAIGAKQIETRGWSTTYRGPIAIHAARGMPGDAQAVCYVPPFSGALLAAGYGKPESLPRGSIVAVCELVDCVATQTMFLDGRLWDMSDQELAFGDYTPGRWAWRLSLIRRVEPIPATGALGLWTWNEPVWFTTGG